MTKPECPAFQDDGLGDDPMGIRNVIAQEKERRKQFDAQHNPRTTVPQIALDQSAFRRAARYLLGEKRRFDG